MMKMFFSNAHHRGFSFVELLVTAAVMALVFGGLLGAAQLAIKLIGSSKASSGALALANERLEYIRSLPYNDVGTVAGIPEGLIPQHSTTTLNGITYAERVFIQYVDAPEDGLGGADENGILADYKQVKVEYTWDDHGVNKSVFLLTNVVPPGIESVTGGGSLTVNVFDATVQPVVGAEVHIYNDTTTSTIDITTNTNVDGVAFFAGAPAAANYQVSVTKAGYSTDGTYTATTSNPNPNPPHVAVLESAVSTMNFQIDALSDLTVRTIGPSTNGSFNDDFDDLSKIASSSNVEISSSELVLSGGAGSYAASGFAFSASTTPPTITSWDTANFSLMTSASTSAVVRVYEVTGTSTYTLIPDSDLPGNSVGYTGGVIDISALDPATYPTLALGTVLATGDSNVTPSIDSWNIAYVITEPSIGNIPFTLTGSKTIGTTATASPVYKYRQSFTTGSGGTIDIPSLEWDSYDVALNTATYDIAEACSDLPFLLDPGVSDTLSLTLTPSVSYALRVSVVDTNNVPIVGADVTLSRAGFNDSKNSSSCGQAFFNSGLGNNADYQVDVSAAGYTNETVTNVVVDGYVTLVITLSP